MSSMLEQAIIDAEALRETAIKNAEQQLIEQYADQIKEAVDSMLEQDDPMANDSEDKKAPEKVQVTNVAGDLASVTLQDPDEDEQEVINLELTAPQDPKSQFDLKGEKDKEGSPVPGAVQEFVSIDLDLLEEQIKLLEKDCASGRSKLEEEDPDVILEDDLEEEIELDEELDILEEEEFELEDGEDDELELEDDDEELSALLEELIFDDEEVPHGHLGAPTEREYKEEDAKAEIRKLADSLEEENQDLKEQNYRRKESLKKLQADLHEQQKVNAALKEHLNNVNVSNAKLLYTNKVLSSTSLNERQKVKIVEAISKTDSVQEAKVIYETLQSSVGSQEKKQPKSLSEAVSRKPSLFLARTQERKQPDHPETNRWKKLAGIN